MLGVGGSVLLPGPHGALLDQVDARVGRLIDALDQRADGMAGLRVLIHPGAAEGVAFEDLAAPVIERAFAQHGDVVEDKHGAQEAARGVKRIEAAHDALRADAGQVVDRLAGANAS